MSREYTGHGKHPLSTTQETTQEMTLHMHIAVGSVTKSDLILFFEAKLEKLYIVSKNKI